MHLTDLALERVHGIWGPLSIEGDKVLKRYSASDLEVIVTFLDDAIRLQERHLLRLRSRGRQAPSTGSRYGKADVGSDS